MKKPVLRSEMVRHEWWDCGIIGHRHQTEGVALNCLLKQARKSKSRNKTSQFSADEMMTILARFDSGESQNSIARDLFIPLSAVKLCISKAVRIRARRGVAPDPNYDLITNLGPRVGNCLRSVNIFTVDDLLHALDQGFDLETIPNMGKKSVSLIMEMLKENSMIDILNNQA